jgi:hypothetical protein
MKWIFIPVLCFIILSVSCQSREREKQLQKREADLNEKEQQLLLREKTIQLQEEELAEKLRKQADTTVVADTLINNPDLVGTWNVKMTCTETSCPGSAVGDVKSENWVISYEGSHVVAKAMVGDKLVRVYSGMLSGNNLELIEHRGNNSLVYDTRMVVRLRINNNKTIEGQREIIRENDCKIIYALQMDKQ